jgi:adenylate kinase family enzyme
MKKVAVFGNAGGGKSTLSKRLSQLTGLPLYVLDKIQYRSNGTEVSDKVPRIYKSISN